MRSKSLPYKLVSVAVMNLIIWTEKENYSCTNKDVHCDDKHF